MVQEQYTFNKFGAAISIYRNETSCTTQINPYKYAVTTKVQIRDILRKETWLRIDTSITYGCLGGYMGNKYELLVVCFCQNNNECVLVHSQNKETIRFSVKNPIIHDKKLDQIRTTRFINLRVYLELKVCLNPYPLSAVIPPFQAIYYFSS